MSFTLRLEHMISVIRAVGRVWWLNGPCSGRYRQAGAAGRREGGCVASCMWGGGAPAAALLAGLQGVTGRRATAPEAGAAARQVCWAVGCSIHVTGIKHE